MAYVLSTGTRTPADEASTSTYGSKALTVAVSADAGSVIYDFRIYSRINGGAWSYSKQTPYSNTATLVRYVTVTPGDQVDWYQVVYWVDPAGGYQVTSGSSWQYYGAADTTDPTITSVTPATGNVAPGGTGVTFQATVQDNYQVKNAKLYVDTVLKQTWTTNGTHSRTESLDLGAHTYEWTAEDIGGNTATTGVVNITVINAVPVVPSGTITVAGETGAVSVANLGAVWISWPAFLDGNPEDSLTYTLENRAAGDAWAQVATGLTGLTYEWSPDVGIGAAELRVKANDGTGDSAYLTRTGITVLSSQAPNAPTLTAPGAVTWREGQTQNVTWNVASPEHPESVACTYEIQFSAAGDFSDLVVITVDADGGTYAWTLATTLVAANTATCKVRIRAVDIYSKVSTWSTSGAFTVQENAVPTVTLVSPIDEGNATSNTPYIIFAVDDADSDALHMEVMLSLRPDFGGTPYYFISALSQENWTEAAAPYSSWTAVAAGGATAGNRMRYLCPALRYDVYFMKWRVYDGILYSAWSDVVWFRVTPGGAAPLTCTIGTDAHNIMGLKVTERTGGEASPMEFRVPLSILATKPIARGAAVSIGLAIEDQSRVWNGTVENLISSGAEVTVQCVQDDAYLARKLVTGDETSADVGAILAAFVNDYGAPLTNDHMDTTLGVTTAIAGQYKSLLDHLREWAQLLGLILWVDSDAEVHLTDPDDMADPEYVLHEEYT